MDRYWHLTWTTYGTRVAGAAGGFVSNVYAEDGGPEVRHNVPGTDCDADMPGLERYVRDHMLADPYLLNAEQAGAVLAQFQETSRVRGYELCAASAMENHIHLVVGVRCGTCTRSGRREPSRRAGPYHPTAHFSPAAGRCARSRTKTPCKWR
jgi:hypothetical protein